MNTFKLGAFAIILDTQQRVLLCHSRDLDLWNLPGGGVESGEAPWGAVLLTPEIVVVEDRFMRLRR